MEKKFVDDNYRVRFYSTSDYSCAFFFARIEEILNEVRSFGEVALVDLLELYHVKQYVDSGIFKKSWTMFSDNHYQAITEKIPSAIGRFFDSNSDVLASHYNEIQIYEYHITFFEILVNFEFITKWKRELIVSILEQGNLEILLRFKKLVKMFGDYIRTRIIEHPEAASILLRKYIMSGQNGNLINLPKELTTEDVSKILHKYINSDNCDISHLTGITLLKDEYLSNPLRLKLLAQKKIDILEKEIISRDEPAYIFQLSVRYHEDQTTHLETIQENGMILYSYDFNWIKDNLDYPTLLNNFIYLFRYVDDLQFRSILINNRKLLDVIEQYTFTTFSGAYNMGSLLRMNFNVAKLQMESYYNLLKLSFEIQLEDVISFFFKDYLVREFKIENYQISMPSFNSTYYEKCKSIAPEIDRVLKELNCLVSEGTIEQGIIEITSDSVPIGEIGSLITKKYIIGQGGNFNRAEYYLCSNQCMLSFLHGSEHERYDSFCELVYNQEVLISDYDDRHHSDLKWLQEQGFIEIDCYGKIALTMHSFVIFDLFKHLSINYWDCPAGYRDAIDYLLERNYVVVEDKFFSKPEREFFNYVLNNQEFNDSLAIRNRYSHGTAPVEEGNERIHEENYYIFLILLIIIIIKLNNELCIADSIEYKSSTSNTND